MGKGRKPRRLIIKSALELNRRRYPNKDHPDSFSGRIRSNIRILIDQMLLSSKIPEIAKVFGGANNVRVLEIGSQSGSLAEHLIRKFGLSPDNYVIGDIDYPKKNGAKGTARGPRLVKPVFLWIKQGRIKKSHMNLLASPPKGIGKFHLILAPNVSGARKFVDSLVKNYLPLLENGGRIMVNRFYGGIDEHGIYTLGNVQKYYLPSLDGIRYSFENAGVPSGNVLSIIKTK